MKTFFLACCFLFLVLVSNAQTVCTLESKQILEIELAKLSAESSKKQEIQDWVVAIAQDFLGTPYVEKTLEIPGPEQLVINLQGVDCTTFLESVVSLARITKTETPNFESFEKELEKLRYRNGKNTGYPSRLHYFSEWIKSNEQKGILKDITREIGGEAYENRPTFMTQNPQFYPQLSNAENKEMLQNIEARIATQSFFFIPKEKIESLESGIHPGDLIAITTPMKNLDIVHVGFAIKQNGRIHLLHASSKNKKVEISDVPLSEYLAGNKGQSGIMVARLQ